MADESEIAPAPPPSAPKDGVDVLNQGEIDRLLEQTSTSETPKTVFFGADGEKRVGEASKVTSYDFRNPIFLTEIELRRLRQLHEDFIRYLSARLSLFLRIECGIKLLQLTTVPYAKFTESLPAATHICLFKSEPMLGVGLLEINPRLAMSIVERMLGGKGNVAKVERALSEIETALLDDVVRLLLEEWCAQWKGDKEYHPSIIGHETTGRYLQTAPKDSVLLGLTMEFTFGQVTEQVQIGVPYATIEPAVRYMMAQRDRDSTPDTKPRRPEWKPVYEHVSVPARAEWTGFELSLREIASLRVGDVVELPSAIVDETILKLNNTAKFIGTVGLDSDRVVVKVTKKISAENRPHA